MLKISSKKIVSPIIQVIMAVISVAACLPVMIAMIFFYLYIYTWLDSYGVKLTQFATDTIMYCNMCLLFVLLVIFVTVMDKFGMELIKIIYEPKKDKKESKKNGASK